MGAPSDARQPLPVRFGVPVRGFRLARRKLALCD